MQQIYRHTDDQLEIYTTVFSPQVCRSRTRSRHVEAEQVVVAGTQYRSRWPKELDLNPGDRIQVLFKKDEDWWFGRLSNEHEGYFPVSCVEQGSDSPRATPLLVRRGSVPVAVTPAGAPCGCTSGRSTPKLLRKKSILLGLEGGSGHSSPGLLHRVLAKSRRKSCPHLPHLPHPAADPGSVNTAFLPDDAGDH
ncbi:uncharacterized protein si:dkey-97a13.12 isoform X2 [Hippoglossus hippoglossus]|uniref:uncharacterized protein si:dkey-97a13.12 isoform X2 n=1 Tax=Hippoglossus hippoglossus TaxID=8267 RepID=UPI00148E40D7|nr:uncharacterized protein si:dkey-97a13.12 isoform X2 [Hippoglossus hippoglossus]